jgi:predicted nucleic acid-binding protein
MIAFDTNVLIYAYDSSEPRRQQVAIDLISSTKDGGHALAGRL